MVIKEVSYHMNSVENANSQSHEWLREINHLLPLRSNRQPRHCQVGFLQREGSRGGECREGQGTVGHGTVLQSETGLWGEQQEFTPIWISHEPFSDTQSTTISCSGPFFAHCCRLQAAAPTAPAWHSALLPDRA